MQIMDFNIVFSVAFILAGCWFLLIAILGLFPEFQDKTTGSLSKTDTKRNFRRKQYGEFIKIQTKYTYIYEVNGKKYKYSNIIRSRKQHILPKIVLVYVKWFPHHAYPYKFKGTKEWAFGLSLILGGLLMLFAMFLK